MSSIQSVNGQPVAGPDSIPTHHGVTPSAFMVAVRSNNPSRVVGISYPLSLKMPVLYQTIDFRSVFA